MEAAYIALGSNLEQPQRQLQAGFAALARLPDTQLIAQSSLYRSAPVGYVTQPDFVNAVAAIRTMLSPRALLDALLAISRDFFGLNGQLSAKLIKLKPKI